MEPLAAGSGLTPLLRPATPLQGDLAAVMREGRILSGEVLQSLGGDSVLIGIGEHRVAADTQVELQPGQRFLFQVESHDGQAVLRLLPDGGGIADPALLEALRALVGEERPVGRVLAEAAAALRAEITAREGSDRESSVLRALLARIEGRAFAPGAGGAALRALLHPNVLGYEATLMAAALAAGADEGAAAVSSLAAALEARLGTGLAAPEVEGAVARALAALAGEGVGGVLDAALMARLGAQFHAALRRSAGARGGAVLAAALDGVEPVALLGGREGALLRALLARGGAMTEGLERAALAALDQDLRGAISRGLLELPEGATRATLARALGALDVDRLLNLARREFGEPTHYAFPVPDGAGWATVDLFLERRPERGNGAGGEDGESLVRVIVGVDLTRLGPVRADLLVRGSSLVVCLSVERPSTAALLRGAARELETRLASEGRRVVLTVIEAPAEKVRVERMAHDIRFLREHHLMDTQG